MAAGPARVRLVAEVADELQHVAAGALGEATHLVDLGPLVLALGFVGRLPALVESDLGALRVVGVVENSLQHDLASAIGLEALVLELDSMLM